MKFSSLALLLTCLLPASAYAETNDGSRSLAPSQEDRRDAQVEYRKAVRAYDAHQYTKALAGFTRAYELAPSFRIQYNIATVSEQLGDRAGALIAFERYLKEGGALIQPKRVEEVEQRITALAKQVGTLRVDADVVQARVL